MGYIVQVPTVDTTLKMWYLPHHLVTNVNKPGKVRRVTNSSSVFKGQSLNISLPTGPIFVQPKRIDDAIPPTFSRNIRRY